MPELRAHRLSKHFSGVRVVKDVSFTIRPGEIVGYLGPNGSGKTTTARMLAGLLEPSSGRRRVRRRATSATTSSPSGAQLGYIPEEPYLYPFLSGSEYLQLIGRLREIPEGAADDEDRGLPRSVRPERRGRSSDRLLLERDAAEDRHLRRAPARSVGRALRRARDRPRRHDDDDAAPSRAHAGGSRQGDSLQLPHPRSRRARLRPGHRAASRATSSPTTRSSGCARCCRATRSRACSRSSSSAKTPKRWRAIWPTSRR